MKARASLLVVSLLIVALPALGQVRQGTVEISPFAGYLFGGTFDRGTTALFSSDVDVDDHATYGLRLGYYVTSKFQIEVQGSRTETAFVVRNADRLFGSSRTARLGDLDIDYLLGYMTFHFGRGRAVPYVTLGGGVARLDPDVPGSSAKRENRFTASIGGGVKVFFNPHVGLRFDGRYYGTSLPDRDRRRRCDDFFDSCDNRSWLSNADVTGGLIVAF